MRKIVFAILIALLPSLAVAQSYPLTLPANTVYGRLGIGPGPGQAIPFATLVAQLASYGGETVTINGTPCLVGGSCSITATAGSIAVGTTTIVSGTSNDILYDAAGVLGKITTAASSVLVTSSGSVPSLATTLPSGLTYPSPVITGTPSGVGSVTTINSTSCTIGGSCTISTPVAIGGTLTGGTTQGVLYDNAGLIGNLATGNSGVLITSAGGAPSISSTLPATVQGNITTTGTLTSGATGAGYTLALGTSTLSGTLPLANGGTAATLTASNGGVIYSNASAFAVLAGTGTPSQCLLSGTNSAPTWGSCLGGAAVSSVGNASADTSLTVGGTGSGPWTGAVTAKLNLSNAQTWTAAQTFTNSDMLLLGTSTGATTFTSANGSGTNYTLTIPAATDTIAVLGATETFTGTKTFSGTANISGVFQYGGNVMTLPGSTATLAALNIDDQTLTGGANVTVNNVTIGSATIDCGLGPLQYIFNSGAFNITAPVNDGSCVLKVINAAGSSSTPGIASLVNFTPKSPGGATYAATATQSAVSVTVANGASAAITWTAHGLTANSPVWFSTSSSMPTGITQYQVYYVVAASITTNTFEIAATPGGTAITTSSTGSGVTGYEPSVFDLSITRIQGATLGMWAQEQ